MNKVFFLTLNFFFSPLLANFFCQPSFLGLWILKRMKEKIRRKVCNSFRILPITYEWVGRCFKSKAGRLFRQYLNIIEYNPYSYYYYSYIQIIQFPSFLSFQAYFIKRLNLQSVAFKYNLIKEKEAEREKISF